MNQVKCKRCGKVYDFDRARLTSKSVTIICGKCHKSFVVKGLPPPGVFWKKVKANRLEIMLVGVIVFNIVIGILGLIKR